MATLGEMIRSHRDAKGWSQTRLAAEAGTSAAYMSQIESGRVLLPNADLRRRLAHALGVSHLDLLIAAGEIAEDEIAYAGATTNVAREDPDSPAVKVCELARRVRWDESREGIIATLERWAESDRKAREGDRT